MQRAFAKFAMLPTVYLAKRRMKIFARPAQVGLRLMKVESAFVLRKGKESTQMESVRLVRFWAVNLVLQEMRRLV